jgi:hypothetical protein
MSRYIFGHVEHTFSFTYYDWFKILENEIILQQFLNMLLGLQIKKYSDLENE